MLLAAFGRFGRSEATFTTEPRLQTRLNLHSKRDPRPVASDRLGLTIKRCIVARVSGVDGRFHSTQINHLENFTG